MHRFIHVLIQISILLNHLFHPQPLLRLSEKTRRSPLWKPFQGEVVEHSSRTVFPNLKKTSHTLLSSYSRKVKWEVARELSSWAVHHRTDGCRGICWPSLGYLHLTWVPSKILRLRCSEFPLDAMAFTPVIPTLPMTLQYNLNHWDDQAFMEQRQGYWMSHASKRL